MGADFAVRYALIFYGAVTVLSAHLALAARVGLTRRWMVWLSWAVLVLAASLATARMVIAVLPPESGATLAGVTAQHAIFFGAPSLAGLAVLAWAARRRPAWSFARRLLAALAAFVVAFPLGIFAAVRLGGDFVQAVQ